MIAVLVAAIVVVVLLLAWGATVLFATELGVPQVDVGAIRRALVVFPHADDETINCGGTIHRLAASGAAVTLVLLTMGEKGTRRLPAAGLKDIRLAEVRRVVRLLGIADVVQADLGDGELRANGRAAESLIGATMERVHPDLVITYDEAGLYGHDDHIACSELVTALIRERHPGTALWYVALPRRLQARVALDDELRARRRAPTHRVFVGLDLIAKMRALIAYRCQFEAVWLLLGLLPYEHFAAAGRR
jgi:LmbE family N-acetylglucosaminyl deacetylase